MQENILEKNLKIISKYNPDLAKKISEHTNLQADYKIEEAQSGDSILYSENIPLDDPTDPVWATIDEIKKNQHKTNECITIALGLGLGYLFKETVKRQKGRIIIHEPNLDVLRIALELVDFSAELGKNNVFLTHTFDDIENAFYKVFISGYPVNICQSYYYSKIEGSYINTFKNKVNDIYGIFQSNYTNLFLKTKIWTSSVFDNIPDIIKHQDLHALAGKFKGKTAVVISAGPSLDSNIKDLLPFRENIVVFCVGTALRTAIANGIIPDFVSVLEISKNTLAQLDVPELSQINVIIANTTYNEVFKLKPKRFFNYYGNKTPASKWLGGIFNAPVEGYEEAGTISLAAFHSAKMLGCDKIIFIGQDLAYTNNQCYSKGSLYGSYKIDETKTVQAENKEEVQKSLNTTEFRLQQHLQLLGMDLVEIPGQNGTKVLTRPDMLLFIKYFEKAAKDYGHEVKMINATEGGAFLEGLEHITLKEALKNYANKEEILAEQIIANYEIRPEKIDKRKKIIHSKLSEIMKTYHQSYAILSNSVEKNIFPYFGEQVKEISNFESLLKYFDEAAIEIIKKIENYKINGLERYIPISHDFARTHEANWTEEEGIIAHFTGFLVACWKNTLEQSIENTFKESIENFNKNLKLIRDDYLNLSLILENNSYIKNYYIEDFYNINNKIRNFEGENDNVEEELVSLSKMLNYFIVISYLYWPESIKSIQQIMKNL